MNIALTRLYNQQIASQRFTQPAEVVAWLGAMQAQDYTGALWSAGLRMVNASEGNIEQAIADRSIVRTWPLRGTLHLVAAQDVHWLLALLTPRQIAGSAGRYRQLELDDATFAASKAVLIDALQGGRQLTRDKILQHNEAAGIATSGQRGYHMLVRAAQDGLICFGVMQNKQQTFTLLDEWIASTRSLVREEALAELTRRYFTSHGPATQTDLMGWAGITAGEAKIGLAGAGSALIQEKIGGQVCWAPAHLPEGKPEYPLVHLLPGFDEYILGYKDRSDVLDPMYSNQICPGGNGVFHPTIVLDGRVIGTWKRAIKKDTVTISLAPFQPLSQKTLEQVGVVARRYGEFLGLSATVN
jgi:hypothetical protein